jgi:hypothetical protein
LIPDPVRKLQLVMAALGSLVTKRSSQRPPIMRNGKPKGRAAFPYEQIFSIVRNARTVTSLCLLVRPRTLPYLARRGMRVPHSSQGGVQFPTGGKAATPSPRAPHEGGGQQIRCNSGADGIVRMKENGTNAACRRPCHCGRTDIGGPSRNPGETGYGKDVI